MQRFVGRFLAQDFGTNPRSENDYIQVAFQIEGGPNDGEIVRWTCSLTSNTIPFIGDAYRAMGWRGVRSFVDCDSRELGARVALDCDDEEYTGRDGKRRSGWIVRFVRPLTSVQEPLTGDARAAVFQRYKDLGGPVAPSPMASLPYGGTAPPGEPRPDMTKLPYGGTQTEPEPPDGYDLETGEVY